MVLSNVGPLMGGEGRVEGREERGVGWEDRRDEQPKTDREDIKIIATATANASDTGNGGSSVVGAYQIRTGEPYEVP